MVYVYPPSRSSRSSSSESISTPLQKPMPLSKRLYMLQKELAALEQELADPSNPLLQKEREENVDPGELIKGLVDVRGKIEKIRKDKQGRGKLIGAVMDDESSEVKETDAVNDERLSGGAKEDKTTMKTFVDIDRRVGELERIIGSSSTALDEVRNDHDFPFTY
jgi:nuclear migration protein JNM1